MGRRARSKQREVISLMDRYKLCPAHLGSLFMSYSAGPRQSYPMADQTSLLEE